jgi:Phosphoglycerate dehydrogenase and related dehydrogenases
MYKVLMTDNMLKNTSIEETIFAQHGIEFAVASSSDPAVIAVEGKDCDALLNIYSDIPASAIASLDKCKAIVRMGIGYNTIDVDAAADKGIMVANVPDYCLDEVADHTWALALSLVRKVSFLNKKVAEGVWNVNLAKPIPRLRGLTMSLFGFGNIAQRVASRAQAFGLNVIAYDPYMPKEVFEKAGVAPVETLDELFAAADILSLHAPLTEGTKHAVNAAAFARMKDTAYVINTSRGPLIDEEALTKALADKQIAGVALDVLTAEPPVFPLPLCEFDNVIVTPHAAFYSESATPDLRRCAAEEVVRTLTEGKPKNWVNRR